MSTFWQRFREGSLTQDDLLGDKVFWYGMLPFIAPSFLGLVLTDNEKALGDAAAEIALLLFGIPMAVVCLLLNARCLPKDIHFLWKTLRIAFALLFAFTLSFSSMGYIVLWNAVTGSDQAVMVSGPVVNLKSEGARWAGREYLVTIRHGGREVKLSALPSEFAGLKRGDTYGKTMKLGGMGYYYSWGLGFWKNLQE